MQQIRPSDNPEFQKEEGRDGGLGFHFLPQNQKRIGEDPSGSPYSRLPNDMPPGENPPSKQAGVKDAGDAQESDQYKSSKYTDAYLIQRAHEIYSTSSDYLDANITTQWETNLAHFNSEHAPGTNFRAKNFRRSAIFRPKTRAVTKSQEAALAVALFATQDVSVVRAENPKDEVQVLSAKINKSILQYRLTKRMRWFQTAIGSFQSTKVYGLTVSHQYWRYETATEYTPAYENGEVVTDDDGNALGTPHTVVRHDKMCCDLIAPENFRFDPMCDWRDPATDSPYLIYLMPMYAGDAVERMEQIDPKTGKPQWHRHALGAILGTRRQDYDRTRQAREGRSRIDPADEQHGNSFTTVWAHMNIIKMDGIDMVYWTMGTELLLTDPVPLMELYPHLEEGERPFVVGFSTIEAFRNYPAGDIEQSAGLQTELNLIVNQRLDNVKLVLNKRYYVKRGAQVDLEALMRNTSGGGVMMNDPEKDVKTIDTNDVTSSSYLEQDRLATEMDDLIGSFSPGSIQSQKGDASKTATGMSQVASTAGAVQDYGIQVFVETWIEPVLRQLIKLIQMYETDSVILTHAAEQSDIWQRFGMNEITDDILHQDLAVNVDVGMGNTDPVRRVERLIYGINQSIAIPGMQERIKGPEITDEIFASLGYKDAGRFFLNNEEFKKLMEETPQEDPPEIMLKKMELEIRREDNAMRDERERIKTTQDGELRMRDIAARENMSMEQLYTNLKIEDDRNQTARDTAAAKENNVARGFRLKAVGAEA